MKPKFIEFYMDVAKRVSQLSTAEKLKVGAILVKNNNILGFSYNGTPSGWESNVCETIVDGEFKTKSEVSHAEENLIVKLAKSSESSENGIMFVTHNPCYMCARMINNAGITEVYYSYEYRDSSGIFFLRKCGIKVEKI